MKKDLLYQRQLEVNHVLLFSSKLIVNTLLLLDLIALEINPQTTRILNFGIKWLILAGSFSTMLDKRRKTVTGCGIPW